MSHYNITPEQWNDPEQRKLHRERLIIENTGLVVRIAKKYTPFSEDNIQIGSIGLINAIDTYSTETGVPFSNYAGFMIEREIHKEYAKWMHLIESKVDLFSIDREVFDNQEDWHNLIEDPKAQENLEEFIKLQELDDMNEQFIWASINAVADKIGRSSRIDTEKWKNAEYMHFCWHIFKHDPSYFSPTTLRDVAKSVNISLPYARKKHEEVINECFERMWHMIEMSYNELLERVRGDKKIPQRLLVFDPGKTTGWSFWLNGRLNMCGQIEDCYDSNNVSLIGILDLIERMSPDFILYEDYKVYGSKLNQHNFSSINTVRIIGAIEAHAQKENIPTHKQMAVTAKKFVTDEKLKAWGFYGAGQRHSRDSMRHAIYFLLFYKKGKDII